jgi:hypothetical protein
LFREAWGKSPWLLKEEEYENEYEYEYEYEYD